MKVKHVCKIKIISCLSWSTVQQQRILTGSSCTHERDQSLGRNPSNNACFRARQVDTLAFPHVWHHALQNRTILTKPVSLIVHEEMIKKKTHHSTFMWTHHPYSFLQCQNGPQTTDNGISPVRRRTPRKQADWVEVRMATKSSNNNKQTTRGHSSNWKRVDLWTHV